ncbi:DNA recombination protein RmuC [Gilvimarinus sp. F26214L]|uniref:DNA recombination protein RmuC n=1 Tax=Gilvimarinus sp. DZF01 TaxID=3461371 RepID=UPI0040461C4D
MSHLNLDIVHMASAAAGFACAVLILGILWRISDNTQKRRAAEAAGLGAERVRQLEETLQDQERALAVAEVRLSHLGELQERLEQKERQLSVALQERATLKTRLESEQGHNEQQLRLLKDARENLAREFENLANKIFESKQQQFSQNSKHALEGTLNPLREQLRDFRKQVEDVYHRENSERNKLVGQISELQKQTRQISQDAVNLATALKGNNKAQGNWGEVILERLLEESGLQKGREYETQVSLKDEAGRRRQPDVIVRLPGNKDIIIDAKVSLVGYESYCSSEDEDEKARAVRNHIASIKSHVEDLSRKNYEKLDNIRTLDFVFIFIPVEAAFMLALQEEPGLFNYAYDKHIVLVSPTTLLATLRTVENIWRYEKQNKNAERIADLAGKLHDQFALVVESLAELGVTIERTQKAFDLTRKRLHTGNGNLYNRIRKLEVLGAKTKRGLPRPSLEIGSEIEAEEDLADLDEQH